MFKKSLFVFATFASSFVQSIDDIGIDTETGKDLACHLFSDDFTLFELTSIDKTGDRDYYDASGIEWKFCSYIEGSTYFARMLDTSGTAHQYIPLTNEHHIPEKVSNIVAKNEDDKNEIVGIKIERRSDVACPADEEKFYSFEAQVMCDI